jgi:hypothetical protein
MSITADDITGSPEQIDEYDEMISNLDELINLGLYKLSGDGRISSNEQKERVRTEYIKRTEKAIRAKREVIKDRRLQEMGKTLEALQESDEFDF